MLGDEKQQVMFGDENVLSTATGRRHHNTTGGKHETHTFKLAMNKCNSEFDSQVIAGRESSNIVDDDSAHNKVHNTHGEDVLTVKKAGDKEDSDEIETFMEDEDNPLTFNTNQAKTITTTLKTAQIGQSIFKRGLSPPSMIKPTGTQDKEYAPEHPTSESKLAKGDYQKSTKKLQQFIADVNRMATLQSEMGARLRKSNIKIARKSS